MRAVEVRKHTHTHTHTHMGTDSKVLCFAFFTLQMVVEGKLPINHEIMYNLQEAFNLMPNLNIDEVDKAFAVKTNDMMMAMCVFYAPPRSLCPPLAAECRL